MHLETRFLRLVDAIADAGTVTAAARRLHLTQPALSHQLRELEQRIGEPLFVRAGHRMVLTALGERVLATARRVLHELDVLADELATGRYADGAGVMRIATECYTCYHWLPGLLAAYHAVWPRVDIEIVPEVTADPVSAVLDGRLDLAIVANPAMHRNLRETPLFEDEMVVVVPPEHPLAESTFVAPRDLANEHLILYSTPHSESSVLRDVLRPAHVEPARLSRVQLTEAILELVKARLGITVLSRWAVAPQLAAGTFVGVPLTRRGFRRQWTAVTRSDTELRDHQRALIELLAKRLVDGPSVEPMPAAKVG